MLPFVIIPCERFQHQHVVHRQYGWLGVWMQRVYNLAIECYVSIPYHQHVCRSLRAHTDTLYQQALSILLGQPTQQQDGKEGG